jgi:hypothetical protein
MRECILLVFVLLLSSAWMMAQYGDQSSGSQQQGTTGSNMGQSSSGTMSDHAGMSSNTLQGCLSGTNGNYTLTDSAGNTYQLMGDSAELSKHVGQQINVTGSMASAGTAMGGANTFNVTKAKKVSGTCGNAGATPKY